MCWCFDLDGTEVWNAVGLLIIMLGFSGVLLLRILFIVFFDFVFLSLLL